jgi:putative FmdB family regulatory protein
MPIYEYACSKCGETFEVMQSMSDAPLKTHGANGCRGKVTKLISQSSFHLKGSGWYVTDYSRKGGADAGGSDGSSSSSKPAETKTESKSAETPAAAGKPAKKKSPAPADAT